MISRETGAPPAGVGANGVSAPSFAPTDPTAQDHQLLGRFVGDNSEAAFETLVRRHGPMVLGVCRRVLADVHLAEDAFQATFLTLACKAGSISKRQSAASWLYKVAFRVSSNVAVRQARHAQHTTSLDGIPLSDTSPVPADELVSQELGPLLDEEINRLPEKFRAVVVLCCLQDKSIEQAALELGCPTGTVLSRLSRARARLRRKLKVQELAREEGRSQRRKGWIARWGLLWPIALGSQARTSNAALATQLVDSPACAVEPLSQELKVAGTRKGRLIFFISLVGFAAAVAIFGWSADDGWAEAAEFLGLFGPSVHSCGQ